MLAFLWGLNVDCRKEKKSNSYLSFCFTDTIDTNWGVGVGVGVGVGGVGGVGGGGGGLIQYKDAVLPE